MDKNSTQYVSDSFLANRYSVSRNTVWRWLQHGTIPQPVKLSPGCTRWRLSDVEAWEASHANGATQAK